MKLMKLVTFCWIALLIPAASQVHAQVPVIAGSFQGWDPPTGPVMTEVSPGIFEATITGLTAGEFHEFKILDTDGITPAWGNPEWTATNNWFSVDPSGNITIRLNTNIGMTGENNQNVGTSSSNWTPQLVGDFMDEAGGTGDWTNPDPLFDMSFVAGTQWTKTLNVSTAGTYLVKIVTNGQWNRQFNNRGWGDLFAEDFSFTTTLPNQDVVFTFDTLTPSLTIEPQVAAPPALVNARPYHNSFLGSDKVDGGVALLQRGETEAMVALGNIISSSQGINGVVLDFDNLADLNDITLEYKWSPQNVFSQPIDDWGTVTETESASLIPDGGDAGSDRVLITWPNASITNRYLCIKVIYSGNTIAELYLGHLRGEMTGASGGKFTVLVGDILAVRTDLTQAKTASGRTDVDKSGTVLVQDILDTRSNLAKELTQLTVPALP